MPTSKPSFIITVLLWVREGRESQFDRYEQKAITIMAGYGGRLETAILVESATSEQPPTQIHVLKFPNAKAFEKYRNDAELLSLQEERRACIEHTEVYAGLQNIQ